MKSVQPGVVDLGCLAPHLWRSFSEWPSPDGAAQVALDDARKRIADVCATTDSDTLIRETVSFDQVQWAMEQAYATAGARFMTPNCAKLVAQRQRELIGRARGYFLEVAVTLLVHRVSLPDAARDEVVLDVQTYSGSPIEEVLTFLLASGVVETQAELDQLRLRWRRSDAAIGENALERQYLEAALGVRFDSARGETAQVLSYAVGPSTGYLWRDCRSVWTLAADLDLSGYPFDRTALTLKICTSFEASEKALVPDDTGGLGTSLVHGHAVAPQGFHMAWQSNTLIPLTWSPNSEITPWPQLHATVELRRKPETFVWRTFAPTAVVLLVGIVASGAALVGRLSTESVTTQVLPSVLIASVAMQLTAAQGTPPRSGRTRLDTWFFGVYLAVLAMFALLISVHARAAP